MKNQLVAKVNGVTVTEGITKAVTLGEARQILEDCPWIACNRQGQEIWWGNALRLA